MTDDTTDAYVRSAAAMIGLALAPESFDAVAANTRILRGFQAQFVDIDLPDDLDPAAVLHL